MRINRKHIPSQPHKAQTISAKGPQDCQALTPEQFSKATIYVAKAFLSAALLPKEFFTGVPVSDSFLSSDGVQRTMLAAFAHFKQNPNLTLSFFYRYKALLSLRSSCDLNKWVVTDQGSEYAVFSADLLSVAARQPLLPSGEFDQESFLAALDVITDQPEDVTQPALIHSYPVETVAFQDRLAA
jgi:hypothetical protein